MIIREASSQDAVAICDINCYDLGYDCDSGFVLMRLKNICKEKERVFVAEVKDKVVGYVHAEKYQTLYFETMINILGLAVSSEYRRHGIGKALLNHTENWAKEIGIRKIRLNSGNSRTEAHSFYRVMGYDNEKKQIRFIKNID